MDDRQLKSGSCVYFTDHLNPSLKFCEDLKDFQEIVSKSSITWVNCPVDDVRKEGCEVAKVFGFTGAMVERLLRGRYSSYVDGDTEFGMLLPAILINDSKVETHLVLVIIKEGLILTIHDRHITRFARFIRYARMFIKKIHGDWTKADQLTVILLRLIDENNRRNFLSLRGLTSVVDNLQRAFANDRLSIPKIATKIQSVRHTLVNVLSVLWENYDIMKVLQEGDIALLSSRPEILERFNRMMKENSTYIQLGENLSNLVGTGSEAMADYYQIRLLRMNNVLAFTCTWLGILGTVFLVPNTIATALASTTYDLKASDAWWYTLMLVLSTVISSFITYKVIRKMWDVTMASIEKRRMLLLAPTHR